MLSLLAGIQALDPPNWPSDGLRPLRDDEAENLCLEISLLADTPTGSNAQPKFREKRRRKYFRVITLNVKG